MLSQNGCTLSRLRLGEASRRWEWSCPGTLHPQKASCSTLPVPTLRSPHEPGSPWPTDRGPRLGRVHRRLTNLPGHHSWSTIQPDLSADDVPIQVNIARDHPVTTDQDTSPRPTRLPPRRCLSAADAADYICHSAGALANWKAAGQGPTFVKVDHHVLYDIAAVDEWIVSAALPRDVPDAGCSPNGSR